MIRFFPTNKNVTMIFVLQRPPDGGSTEHHARIIFFTVFFLVTFTFKASIFVSFTALVADLTHPSQVTAPGVRTQRSLENAIC